MGDLLRLLLVSAETILASGLLQVISYAAMGIGAIFILYAIYLGFVMMTASDADKRHKAKDRVIKAFAAIFIIVVLVILLQVIAGKTSFGDSTGIPTKGNGMEDWWS